MIDIMKQGLGQARPNKKLSQRGKNFQELKICGHGTILALSVFTSYKDVFGSPAVDNAPPQNSSDIV